MCNWRKSIFALAAVILLVCVGHTEAAILFTDDFSGTTLDPAKWTIRKDVWGGDPSKGHWQQDDSLQMMWERENTGYIRAISVPTFDTSVDTYEVKTWQDGTSGWQDWGIQMITPLGTIGYYNYRDHWLAQWADSDGNLRQASYLLRDARVTPFAEYGMKIQLRGSRLEFCLDLADGAGYQLAHSTEDFSLPLTHYAGGQPVAPGHVVLSSSDLGWTYYDDLVVSRVIPEPSTFIIWSLIGLTFAGIGWRRRRRKA